MDKTYVFENGEANNGLYGLVSALCNKQGIDPSYLMAMMNNNGMNGGGGWWAWIIILLIFGWNGFGNGGFGGGRGGQGLADVASLVNSDNGRELIMSAVQGNSTAISQLASTLNCDVNALQGAINNLQTQLCTVGNSVGLTGQQVINSIQMGNANIASQLAECCCNLRESITRQGYENQLATVNQTNTLQNAINFVNSSVERGFASTQYETQNQTNAITKAIADQTAFINQQFCNLEMREMQNKIDSLRLENQTLRFAESQQQQNNYLISQLQPVAKPAYLTCSPYQAQMLPYGYNPYNGGCCVGNNGCC